MPINSFPPFLSFTVYIISRRKGVTILLHSSYADSPSVAQVSILQTSVTFPLRTGYATSLSSPITRHSPLVTRSGHLPESATCVRIASYPAASK